jgi:hypothetical protein
MRIAVSAVIGVCAGFCILSALGAGSAGKAPAQDDDRYVFLPARQNLWVVDNVKSQIIFFKFPDREDRPIQRSKVFSIDRTRFPRDVATFVLSEREVTSILWIVNSATGDVQVVRYQRDGTVGTPFNLLTAPQFE